MFPPGPTTLAVSWLPEVFTLRWEFHWHGYPRVSRASDDATSTGAITDVYHRSPALRQAYHSHWNAVDNWSEYPLKTIVDKADHLSGNCAGIMAPFVSLTLARRRLPDQELTWITHSSTKPTKRHATFAGMQCPWQWWQRQLYCTPLCTAITRWPTKSGQRARRTP